MTGYSMLDSQVDANQGNVNFLYEGDGGISQFYFGNSYSLTRNLSVGFNLSYLFGTLNKSSRSEFPDSLLKLNYNVLNSAKVHDVYLDYGLFFINNWHRAYNTMPGLCSALIQTSVPQKTGWDTHTSSEVQALS